MQSDTVSVTEMCALTVYPSIIKSEIMLDEDESPSHSSLEEVVILLTLFLCRLFPPPTLHPLFSLKRMWTCSCFHPLLEHSDSSFLHLFIVSIIIISLSSLYSFKYFNFPLDFLLSLLMIWFVFRGVRFWLGLKHLKTAFWRWRIYKTSKVFEACGGRCNSFVLLQTGNWEELLWDKSQ